MNHYAHNKTFKDCKFTSSFQANNDQKKSFPFVKKSSNFAQQKQQKKSIFGSWQPKKTEKAEKTEKTEKTEKHKKTEPVIEKTTNNWTVQIAREEHAAGRGTILPMAAYHQQDDIFY